MVLWSQYLGDMEAGFDWDLFLKEGKKDKAGKMIHLVKGTQAWAPEFGSLAST